MRTLTVRDLMTAEVESLLLGETMDLAHTILRLGRIHHLPVVDEAGHLRGLVTPTDLLKGAALAIQGAKKGEMDPSSVKVEEIMTTEMRTVTPQTPAVEAAEIIWKERYTGLPVVEGERLVGILTEADFVKMALERC